MFAAEPKQTMASKNRAMIKKNVDTVKQRRPMHKPQQPAPKSRTARQNSNNRQLMNKSRNSCEHSGSQKRLSRISSNSKSPNQSNGAL